MALEIPADLARRLIGDPVMAAKVLMGAELDVFQAARLRYAWFVPAMLDHSGISTAKSEIVFILAFLRLMLLPNPKSYLPRVVAVYYQQESAAIGTFIPKLEKYCEKSKIFELQIKKQRGGMLYRKVEGCIVIEMRNGGRCELPAGDFARNAKNQASRRFNDAFCDETGEMDKMGDGVNMQIIGRATLECFNPNHPIWCNHRLFLGHAESPDHPYHKRFAAMRNAARRGSQGHVVFCANFDDYQGKYREKYGQEAAKVARDQKLELDEAEYAWIWLGEWKRPSMGWYSKQLRDGVLRIDVKPQLRRVDDGTLYFLGWDTAGGMKAGADWNNGTVTAATPVRGLPNQGESLVGYMELNGQWWFVRPVYSLFLFSKTVDQLAGVIHSLHLAFGFTGITLDSQGGGAFIYKKLVESRQFINNQWVTLAGGLCLPQDQYAWPMAEPIISMFDRGDPLFRELFGEKYLKDNSGPVDYAHRQMMTMMRRASVAWPADKETRLKANSADFLTQEEAEVLEALTKVLNQFGGIGVKVDKQKMPSLSSNGFQQYTSSGKKDGAMATLYSFLRMLCHLNGMKQRQEEGSAAGFY